MKRHVRRFSRKLGRQIDGAKSKLDGARSFVSTLGRSNSDYYYSSRRSFNATPTITPVAISDTDDDLVFEGTEEIELPAENSRHVSPTRIPCEFCHVLQTTRSLGHHQLGCRLNPNSGERRRYLTTNDTTNASRPRAASDRPSTGPPVPARLRSPVPVPSAPPRSRSPSPTEGFPVPKHLTCPITLSLFRDPVVASDGHTYERSAILDCLRTSRKSPMTRQNISAETLNPNLLIKNLVDEFRAECKRRRDLHKYILDIDVTKKEEIKNFKSNHRTVYQAEWIKKNSSTTESKIILTHLTGDNAGKLGEIISRLGLHPNLVRTFGTVEHNGTGILLLQEDLPAQTLARLIKTHGQKFSIPTVDMIVSQIVSALQHLAQNEIVYGTITADDIFIYQFDDNPEDIVIKLSTLGDLTHQQGGDEISSEKTDVFVFGVLMQELYALGLATDDEDILERLKLSERCLASDPDLRPTFEELTKTMDELVHQKKFIF